MNDIFFYSPVQVMHAPSPPVPSASAYALCIGATIALITALLTASFTQCLIYHFQGRTKRRESDETAKNMLRYINMVLCLEYSQLASIAKILEQYDTGNPRHVKLQKFIFTPIIVKIQDEHIQKLLASPDFRKRKESTEVIQGIVYAETLYRRCLSIIEQYNNSLEEERLSKADEKVREALVQSAVTLQKAIGLAREEAFKVNTNAREKIQSLGKSLYGKDLLLATVDQAVVLATEL